MAPDTLSLYIECGDCCDYSLEDADIMSWNADVEIPEPYPEDESDYWTSAAVWLSSVFSHQRECPQCGDDVGDDVVLDAIETAIHDITSAGKPTGYGSSSSAKPQASIGQFSQRRYASVQRIKSGYYATHTVLQAEEFRHAHSSFTHAGLHIIESDEFIVRAADGSAIDIRTDYEAYKAKLLVIDENGKPAGRISRNLDVTGDGNHLVVDLDRILLEPHVKGRGFGPAYHRHMEEQYRSWGVSAMSMTAVEIGAYKWALDPHWQFIAQTPSYETMARFDINKDDSRFSDPHFLQCLQAAELWHQYGSRLEQLAWSEKPELSSKDYLTFKRRFASPSDVKRERWAKKISTPNQIALFGQETPWTDRHGDQTHMGRHLLLGHLQAHRDDPHHRSTAWQGIKLL